MPNGMEKSKPLKNFLKIFYIFYLTFHLFRPLSGLSPLSIDAFHPNMMMMTGGGTKISTGANSHHHHQGGALGSSFKPSNFAPLMNGGSGTSAAMMKPMPVQQMLPPSNATVLSHQSTKQSNHKSRQSTEGEYQVIFNFLIYFPYIFS